MSDEERKFRNGDSPHFQMGLLDGVSGVENGDSPLRIRVSAKTRRLSLRVYPDARVECVVPPRARPREIVGREPAVVGQADGEREQVVGGAFAEPPVPQRLPSCLFGFAHFDPGPWRRDQVWAERPQRRTKPSESA